jgi:hypothetical protein
MTASTNTTDDMAMDALERDHAAQIDRVMELDVRADFRDEPLDLRPWRLPETLLRPQTEEELHRSAFPRQGSVAELCERELAAWRTCHRSLLTAIQRGNDLEAAYNNLALVYMGLLAEAEQHDQMDPSYEGAPARILKAHHLT